MSMLYKETPSKENILVVLYEGGMIASLKLENNEDDFTSALLWLEDDYWADIVIPIVFALAAILSIFIKRRTANA